MPEADGRHVAVRHSGGAGADAADRIRGKPHKVVSENDTELTSSAILGWSLVWRVVWHYIAPGNAHLKKILQGTKFQRAQSAFESTRSCPSSPYN